jgi:hypothetical protein
MSKFDERINDLFGVLTEAALLNTVLNTIILFLMSYIFLNLISLYPLHISSIISLIYFLNVWIKKSGLYDIKLVEKKFPFLKERLSTAKETLNKDNFVINALRIDVTKRINHIDASTFFRKGRTFIKISVILILLFSLMFLTINNVKITNLDDKINKFNISKLFSFWKKDKVEVDNTFNLDDNIDPSKLDDEDYNFKKEEFISLDELNAIGSQEYRDTITDEEKEIVKKYFETITNR